MQDLILVLDHDRSLASLITRTLRSQQVYCELVPFDITLEQVQNRSVRGLILAVSSDVALQLDNFDFRLLDAGLPILALGAMVPALCKRLGGEALHQQSESESVTLGLVDLPIFEGMGVGERVLHDLHDLHLPESLQCLATATERCIGFLREATALYAVQYSIERNDPDAILLLRNFACLVCGLEPLWTEDYIIQQAVEQVRSAAGEGHVLCTVSGGVDSAVCARIARMAVGDRLMCVFVDNGLFRKDEPNAVIETYMETLGLVVAYVDTRDDFLMALKGIKDAGKKEHIISALLDKVLNKQLHFDPSAHTLVLGTNFNDTLYGTNVPNALSSGDGDHLVQVIEPLRHLFKEEVRRVARALALPDSITERQPFPSSGLALRIFGEVTEKRLALLRQADAFFTEEVHATGQERRLWQYYATMSENPDQRTGYAVILRACQACSGEACASRLPYDLLERVMARIMKELPEITRVLYDLTPSQHYAQVE